MKSACMFEYTSVCATLYGTEHSHVPLDIFVDDMVMTTGSKLGD